MEHNRDKILKYQTKLLLLKNWCFYKNQFVGYWINHLGSGISMHAAEEIFASECLTNCSWHHHHHHYGGYKGTGGERRWKIKRWENVRGYLSVTTKINQRILSPSVIPCFPSLFFLSDHWQLLKRRKKEK